LIQVVNAQTSTSESISQACSAPEFRQFDYWMGEWTVRNTQGDVIGSSVSRISNGCALLEEWSSAQGNDGKSINFYDSSIGQWRQTWVGGGGLILDLEGGLDEGNMTLSQTKETPQGSVTHRITWTSLDDGRVEQKWDTSNDGGETWRQSFVGLYERRDDS
jgi:hypothetical protein